MATPRYASREPSGRSASRVVLGNLEVDGKLSNYEGRCVFVGGDLRAKAIYTEGPLLVLGDVRADVVYGFYSDYGLQVGGKLAAKILVQHDHSVDAGELACIHLRLPVCFRHTGGAKARLLPGRGGGAGADQRARG